MRGGDGGPRRAEVRRAHSVLAGRQAAEQPAEVSTLHGNPSAADLDPSSRCSVLQPYANAAGQCAAHNAADEHGARQAALGLRPATLDVHRRGRHGMGSGLHRPSPSSSAQGRHPECRSRSRPPGRHSVSPRSARRRPGRWRRPGDQPCGCCRPACSPARSRARSRAAASPNSSGAGPSEPRAGRRSPSTSRRASCPAHCRARRCHSIRAGRTRGHTRARRRRSPMSRRSRPCRCCEASRSVT